MQKVLFRKNRFLEEMTHKALSVSQSSGLSKKCSEVCMFVNAGHSKNN